MIVNANDILHYSNNLTILYVEDDRIIREQVVEVLQEFFHQVIVASNGAEGLSKYINFKAYANRYPDLVITDIAMVDFDGVDMSKKILELNEDQIIIVNSSYNKSELLIELINMGISFFFLKPIEEQQFYQTLYKASRRFHFEKMELMHKEELENAIRRSEDATKAKDEFLANMSHEIRTPMNAIIGLSHILKDTSLNETQSDYVGKIHNSGELLLGIINDILDFSKIEAGKLDVENIPFNLNTTLDNVSNMIGAKAKEKGLELVFNIDNSVPAMIKGDPLRLGQVIINLMNNAVKFTDKGEIVLRSKMITTKDDKTFLEFQVIDSGIGLTPEHIGKLFQSFSQADSSTSRKYGGSGLGLTISKQLVGLMGGKIWVESEYGKGSCFNFTIETEQLERRSYRLPSRSLMHKKVLIVDGNAQTSAALIDMLKYFQFTALHASNRLEAKMLISNNTFDMVFIDREIMSACESQYIKENCQAKIVLMENAFQLMTESRFNNIPIHGNLAKPFNQQMLFSMIVDIFTQKGLKSVKKSDKLLKKDLLCLEGSTLLLAEDNVINQTVVLGLLENTGIKTIIANNGLEVLEQLDKNKNIEIVLMDINMPQMDGYEATLQLRKNSDYDDIPVIALTANAMQKDIDKAKDTGMQEHLGKPIDVHTFYALLLKYITVKVDMPHIEENILTGDDGEENEDKILEELYLIKELNVDSGIERVGGDVIPYKNILFEFSQLFKDSVSEFKDLINSSSHDEALKLAHNIKGTAGNIGAEALFKLTNKLERALAVKGKNKKVLLLLVTQYELSFKKLLFSIENFFNKKEIVDKEKSLIEENNLNNILEKILFFAKKRKAMPCKKLVKELNQYAWPEEYEDELGDIVNLLNRYKFKEAMEIIEEIS
ncbi:MAG: response regulator [Campylobacterota bacterium]|nr:response regulator [Campylobacterota bacterium]